jgi:hypothetical protein
MKKNINIGGIIFHIEEGGYDKLKEYLDTWQRSAASYNAPSAIMADIENRIAETFLNKLKDGLQVVTLEDVEDLIVTKEGFNPFKTIKYTNYVYLF